MFDHDDEARIEAALDARDYGADDGRDRAAEDRDADRVYGR